MGLHKLLRRARCSLPSIPGRRTPVTRSLAPTLALALLIASPALAADIARYILPPADYGGHTGLQFNAHSTDQLPLYSGLSPLRDNITLGDIDLFYLPENFEPIGAGQAEDTGRAGTTLIYDDYGIPHVYGQTRED